MEQSQQLLEFMSQLEESKALSLIFKALNSTLQQLEVLFIASTLMEQSQILTESL